MTHPNKLKAEAQKVSQRFDPEPPRCITCVYFRREPHTLFKTEQRKNRRGQLVTRKVPLRKDAILNPIVDRCSFGNFLTKPHGVCDEWHSKTGETIEKENQHESD